LSSSKTYSETLDYLFSRLPVYQHIGKAAYKADLNNTVALCAALGNPENGFKSIHVAGTNGKGSTSSALAAIFTANGYKTGLYTSPHLFDFRERIRIDGVMIPEQYVVDFTEKMKPLISELNPSFFELTVAMAFQWFTEQKVEIAIVEVGMGGRLDSTNVVTPELSVITNIGFDHMDFLGDTKTKIAAEKAGIIKLGVPVVIGEWDDETKPVFEIKAEVENSKLIKAIEAPAAWINSFALKGDYQRKNLATVYASVQSMRDLGWPLADDKIINALENVKLLSGIKGRWDILRTQPLVIADVAHNDHGLIPVLKQFMALPHHQMHFVLGVVNDKDLSKILPLFPKEAKYYFCKPNIMRGLDSGVLQERATVYGLLGQAWSSVKEALQAAISAADAEDIVFVGGSTFVVAEVVDED